MADEILDMKEKMESSKYEVLDETQSTAKVNCNKMEIVNPIHEKMKKFDKFSEVFVKIIASQNMLSSEVFVKIVSSQNMLSSTLKGIARNLPQRDGMMNKHELSQSLAEIKQNIQRNKPMDKNEMVGHLKQ